MPAIHRVATFGRFEAGAGAESGESIWRSRASATALARAGATTTQVALELGGDGFARRGLQRLVCFLTLLESPDVLGNLFVLRGDLGNFCLPFVGLLRQRTERHLDVQDLLDPVQQRQGCLRRRRL